MRQAARPMQVQPGDIFLCGPDRWGIHHVVMSIGQMRPAPEAGPMLVQDMPELRNMDIFSCETIESTHSSLTTGQEIVWYASKNFFARNRVTGEAVILGDIGRGSDTLEWFEQPIKVKLLMHPLRPGHGGPAFDPRAFQQALEISARASQHWSIRTAVNGIMNRRELQGLDPNDYPDAQSRSALMHDLQKRWEKRPICTSVAIMVWQRYFALSSGPGPQGIDTAVQQILRWMPLLSDKTLPSALIKELSKCGWVMRGNLDA